MNKNNNTDIISNNRIIILGSLMVICLMVIIARISYLQLFDIEKSKADLSKLSTKIVYSDPMPRGKIYDRNYNVIVDNIGIHVITYKKESGMKTKDEISLSYLLAENLNIDYSNLSTRNLKDFWIVNNDKLANKKITDKEYKLYEERKLSSKEIEKLKLDRITKEELNKFSEFDKEAAYIYYLMHNGYYYDEKVIKEEITDEEYLYIMQNKSRLKGINIITSWKRVYPYGDTLRQILGNVSTSKQGVPIELKNAYLSKGYSLNDRVGLSYLEYQYEDVLKGTKNKHKIQNGKKTLIEEGIKGNDLVLSVDINLQLEVEKILEEELINAMNDANTDYYNNASVIITDPNTGNILAMASKQITKSLSGYKITDYTTNLLTNSQTPGSIVKGASMLTGYSSGKLKIGDVLYDKCIKFKNTPEKCSWKKSLGALNDIKALELSSNSYQFQVALKIAGINYYHNMPIKVNSDAINTYRSVFESLGLGVKSGIDLPNETIGYKGKEINAGLLLNYAIGQYDTYSILQLSSYLNTIINNGDRLKLNLVKEIRYPSNDNSLGKIKETYEKQVLNKVNIDEKYFNRVKEGFISVMKGSLGKGYMGSIVNPAGKTGTAETFLDTNNDKKVDKETYSKSFIGYAPYDNPKMSIVVLSPHVSFKNDNNTYTSSVNKKITSRICNIFFEIYK